MEKKEIILSGPEVDDSDSIGSVAEFIIPKLKSLPKDKILQVDLKTDERITAHEFLKMSLEVTEGVLEFGVKAGEVVVLAAPNSIRTHVTAFGIICSGAVLTPIDHNLKPGELQHFLKQFRPKCVVCHSEKAGIFKSSLKAVGLDAKVVLLDVSRALTTSDFHSWDDIRTAVDVANYVPRKASDPKRDLALICCSSGSSGLPKGVALPHCVVGFHSRVVEFSDFNGLLESTLFISPVFWISGIMVLLISLVSGITLCLPKSKDAEDLLEAIEKFKPVFLFLSPVSTLSVVNHPNFEKTNLESVKVVMNVGAVIGAPAIQRVLTKWKNIIFVQSYGLTEVGGGVTMGSNTNDVTSVGKLLPGVQMKVVDVVTGESLGPNKVGEAVVKSKAVMNGYYNNKEATEAAVDGNGWLRTGDLVYYDKNEQVFIVDRVKEIIKSRNYQISPLEIESFINSLPGVKESAIWPVPHETDTFRLKALVVKNPESDITAEDIIESVKDNFSDPKQLKEGVQFVDALPRTESGKLKRKELNQII